MPRCLLIIDDDPGMRDLIQFSVEALTHWTVLTAASGEEGIAMAQYDRPDAILLDLTMPDMNGRSVVTGLKADPQTRAIAIIVLTGQSIRPDPDAEYESPESLESWIVGVIRKPFTPQGLVSQIQHLLGWTLQ